MSRVAIDVADDTLPAGADGNDLARAAGALGACLSENTVLAFLDGQAGEGKRDRIDAHIDACSVCAQLVTGAARDESPSAPGSAQPPWPTAFAKGSLLAGRFTIVRFVARGGMGEVYEAFDEKVPERVALKTMLCTLSDDTSAIQRLCEEVKLARRIAHRNVCRIHELHEHRDDARGHPPLHFLAMEFVDGETLKETLRAGPLPAQQACVLARQLLCGLGAAHDAGVLHLDFKSQNVMLRASGASREALIMDFSLSRAFETEARLHASERQLVGTPGYISPEQLQCLSTLGPASDIYSFGVVFFEMLTGRLPFEGRSATAVLLKQLKGRTPRPSEVVPGLPTIFDRFVLECLQRDPSQRFADAASALAALEECLAKLRAVPAKGRGVVGHVQPIVLAAAMASALSLTSFGGTPRPPDRLERAHEDIRSRAAELQPEPALPRVAPAQQASVTEDEVKPPTNPPPPARVSSTARASASNSQPLAAGSGKRHERASQAAPKNAATRPLQKAISDPGGKPSAAPAWAPTHAPPRLY
jgi:serine/threonine protein kinase